MSSTPVKTADFSVSAADQLAAAISTANSNGDAPNTITLAGNIDLTQLTPSATESSALPTVGQTGGNKSLIINGAGNAIGAGGRTRIFFANTGTIANLAQALYDEQDGRQAFERLRSVIEEVRLTPAEGELAIDLKGDLAEILKIGASAAQDAESAAKNALQIKVVAGACFDRDLSCWC
ncbi:MAG: hypothetical protein AB7E81_22365 [Hyphomicrobiaceae bacterium]